LYEKAVSVEPLTQGKIIMRIPLLILFTGIVVTMLFLSGCVVKGNPTSVVMDRQIRLHFPKFGGYGFSTSDTTGIIMGDIFYITKFDKANYCGVDSIIFVGFISTSDINNTCVAELVRLSDTLLIENSRITTNDTAGAWVESGNIYSSIPAGEMDFGIRLISEYGARVGMSNGYLFLYRH
jgi:hypothetical protein